MNESLLNENYTHLQPQETADSSQVFFLLFTFQFQDAQHSFISEEQSHHRSKKKRTRKKKKARPQSNLRNEQSCDDYDHQIRKQMLMIQDLASKDLPIETLIDRGELSMDSGLAKVIYHEYQMEREQQRRGLLIRRACCSIQKAVPLFAALTEQPVQITASLLFDSLFDYRQSQAGPK